VRLNPTTLFYAAIVKVNLGVDVDYIGIPLRESRVNTSACTDCLQFVEIITKLNLVLKDRISRTSITTRVKKNEVIIICPIQFSKKKVISTIGNIG
jgi:hypothetical protein